MKNYFTFIKKVITNHKRVAFFMLAIFVAIMGWFFVTGQENSSVAQKPMSVGMAREIEIVMPRLQANANTLLLLGTVYSNEAANIYARRQGIVKDVFVDIGDTVTEGQIVAILLPRGVEGESAADIQEKRAKRDLAVTRLSSADDVADEAIDQAEEEIDELKEKLDNAKEDRDATVAKAQADLDAATTTSEITVARAELDKVRTVEESKVDSIKAAIKTAEDSLDFVEAQQEKNVDTAKASVGVAEASLAKTAAANGHVQIRSPFSGVISKRFLDVGEMIMTSQPAFGLVNVPTTLSEEAKREVMFGLPEDLNDELSVGDEITFFTADNESQEYTATVTRKSPEVDQDSRDFMVRAKLSDSDMLPHRTSVRVRLVTSELPVYQVPSKSIKRIDDKNYVWIMKGADETPQRLEVSVRVDDGEFSDVTGELSEDMRIVKRPRESMIKDAIAQEMMMEEEPENTMMDNQEEYVDQRDTIKMEN